MLGKSAREESEELSGDAKDEIEEAIRDPDGQRDDLMAEFEEIWKASDEKWEDAKQGVEDATGELRQSLG